MEYLIFSYGSNLFMPRLLSRVHKARFINIVQLSNHQLCFHKLGRDGSGKASLIPKMGEQVWGSLCALEAQAKQLLDRSEGLGTHYVSQNIEVFSLEGQQLPAVTYVAHPHKIQSNLLPFYWYKQYIVAGAKQLQLPKHYIQQLSQVITQKDADELRRLKHSRFLQK